MAWLKDIDYLRRAVEISRVALESGNEPFGALLVDMNGNIILEEKNSVADLHDHTAHDAFLVASRASQKFEPEFLWNCTLYSTIEPCFMCLGGVFWANIGKIKYAMAETELNKMFGGDPLVTIHSEHINPRLAKDIEISGPYPEIISEVKAVIQMWLDKNGPEK